MVNELLATTGSDVALVNRDYSQIAAIAAWLAVNAEIGEVQRSRGGDVCVGACRGGGNKCEKIVELHLGDLLKKLGVRNQDRTELGFYARAEDSIDESDAFNGLLGRHWAFYVLLIAKRKQYTGSNPWRRALHADLVCVGAC